VCRTEHPLREECPLTHSLSVFFHVPPALDGPRRPSARMFESPIYEIAASIASQPTERLGTPCAVAPA